MEYHNGIACVPGSVLIKTKENPEGLIKKSKYDRLSQKGSIKVVRRACYNTPALLEYDTLPDEIKDGLLDIGIIKTARRSVFEAMIRTDYEAREFFAEYMLADGRYLPGDKQLEYSLNAEVLNAINELVNSRKAMRKALGGSTKNIWPRIAEQTKALRPDINHTLPDNHRRLSDRLRKYKNGSYESLISRKWLNNNAKKVVDEEQEATLRQLLRKHNNFDDVQIRDLYNLIAEKLTWETISTGTVANYRKKWDLFVFSGRKGEKAFDNTKAMIIKRKAPALPLVYWTVDGWDVELLYQKTSVDKKGNKVTTYHLKSATNFQ